MYDITPVSVAEIIIETELITLKVLDAHDSANRFIAIHQLHGEAIMEVVADLGPVKIGQLLWDVNAEGDGTHTRPDEACRVVNGSLPSLWDFSPVNKMLECYAYWALVAKIYDSVVR